MCENHRCAAVLRSCAALSRVCSVPFLLYYVVLRTSYDMIQIILKCVW